MIELKTPEHTPLRFLLVFAGQPSTLRQMPHPQAAVLSLFQTGFRFLYVQKDHTPGVV